MTTVSEPSPVLQLRLGTNNVFALPDNRGATLIDAGPDYEGSWGELLAQMAAYRLGIGDVHTVILTHAHLDHAGLAARWQSVGARILVGHDDAPALALGDAGREQERRRARATLMRHGVPPDALAAPISGGERYTRWPAPLRMTPVRPDRLLHDGDEIEASRDTPRVVACPGHTPGTILVVDAGAGRVFTGDHVLPRMAPTSGIQFDGERRRPSLPAYLASLTHTRALGADVPRVYPGHGEPGADLAAEADWAIRLLEQRARRLWGQLQQGRSTAYGLALRLFPHLSARHLRPVLAETIGLLDLLVERGQARADESGPVIVWHSTQETASTWPATP